MTTPAPESAARSPLSPFSTASSALMLPPSPLKLGPPALPTRSRRSLRAPHRALTRTDTVESSDSGSLSHSASSRQSDESAATVSSSASRGSLASQLLALPSTLAARLSSPSGLALVWGAPEPPAPPDVPTPEAPADDETPVRRRARSKVRSKSMAEGTPAAIPFRRPSVVPFRSRIEELQDVTAGIPESSSSSSSDSEPCSSERRPRHGGRRAASSTSTSTSASTSGRSSAAGSSNASPCKRRATLSSGGAARELRISLDHQSLHASLSSLSSLAAPLEKNNVAPDRARTVSRTGGRSAKGRPSIPAALGDTSAEPVQWHRPALQSPPRRMRTMPPLTEGQSSPAQHMHTAPSPERTHRARSRPSLSGLGLIPPPRTTSAVSLVTASCVEHVETDRQRPRIAVRFRDPWHPDATPPRPHSPASMCSVPMLTVGSTSFDGGTPRSTRHKRSATASDVPSLVFSRVPADAPPPARMSQSTESLPPRFEGGRLSLTASPRMHEVQERGAHPARPTARFARSQSAASIVHPPAADGLHSPRARPRPRLALPPFDPDSAWAGGNTSPSPSLPPLSPSMHSHMHGPPGFAEARKRRPGHTRMRSAKRFEDLHIDVGLARGGAAAPGAAPPLSASAGRAPAAEGAAAARTRSRSSVLLFSPRLADVNASDAETPPLSAASSSESDAESSSAGRPSAELGVRPLGVGASLGKGAPPAPPDILSLEEALLIATLGPASGRNRRSSSFSKDSVKLSVARTSLRPAMPFFADAALGSAEAMSRSRSAFTVSSCAVSDSD